MTQQERNDRSGPSILKAIALALVVLGIVALGVVVWLFYGSWMVVRFLNPN